MIDLNMIIQTLHEAKAKDIEHIPTPDSPIADACIICTATSHIHLSGIAHRLCRDSKAYMPQKPRAHGQSDSGWVIVDLDEYVVHIMLNEQRAFYQLEKLLNATMIQREQQE